MKNFLELLAIDLHLTVLVNGATHEVALNAPLEFDANDCVSVDGYEILPKYRYLSTNNKLVIAIPFYQWLHHASGQGWLLTPQ